MGRGGRGGGAICTSAVCITSRGTLFKDGCISGKRGQFVALAQGAGRNRASGTAAVD